MFLYKVKGKNKRGYIQESRIFESYSEAFTEAMEYKDSNQYSVIVILEDTQRNYPDENFLLKRIIK